MSGVAEFAAFCLAKYGSVPVAVLGSELARDVRTVLAYRKVERDADPFEWEDQTSRESKLRCDYLGIMNAVYNRSFPVDGDR